MASFDRRAVLAGLASAVPAFQVGRAQGSPRIRILFAGQAFTATLLDNPTALSFLQLLPQDLVIEDYSTNEKIIRLASRLSEDGSGPFGGEAAGDVCYYAPWGNLALFHAAYRYSTGLIRIGRLDGGIEPLLRRGRFPVRVERAG